MQATIFLATCFGVFVLPFLLPPPYVQGISASYLAGFNNEVAAVAAAGMGVLVFALALKWPRILGADGSEGTTEDGGRGEGRIPRVVVAGVVLVWGCGVLLLGLLILHTGVRFQCDWGYFLNRIAAHADYGRKLYSEMEFAYGPWLLEIPIGVRVLMSPLHTSTAVAYLVTLLMEVVGGLLLLVYVIEQLPMSREWRVAIFLLCGTGAMVGNMGLNHTFFRFAPQLLFLMLAWKSKRGWVAALVIFAGEAICLGISPEIGFAFLVGSLAFAVYQSFARGWSWAWTVAAPVLSAALFLVAEGLPYLERLGGSAKGRFSFPVEPEPIILVFLFALVWLVPDMLAKFFRERRAEAPMLGALYLMSLALLPAGFGRADPIHVFWNGLSVVLLSAVAISSRRRPQQIAWGGSLAVVILYMFVSNLRGDGFQLKPIVRAEAAEVRDVVRGQPHVIPVDDGGFDLQKLQAIVGHDPVATPLMLRLPVEDALRASGQFRPSFYEFPYITYEDRQIDEMNQFKWAVIPDDLPYHMVERPEDLKALGIQFPYRTRRPVYVLGEAFENNLEANWKLVGTVGHCLVYERR